MARYIGIDLHRNRFTVCMIAENGRKYSRTVEMAQLENFAKNLRQDDEVAVEMTTNTRLFKGAVEKFVSRVVIVNAAKFKVISESTKKTDKHDAENLAVFLRANMLPELRMKDAAHERLHSLCQTKDKLTQQRTQLKNKINNILAALGILLRREEMSSNKALERIMQMDLPVSVLVEIEIICEQIKSLNTGIAKLKREIAKAGEQFESYQIISSVKGIGEVSAAVLLSIIGDINDFEHPKKLAAYFGLVPRVSNSNETEHSGRITKRGSKLGRTTLVQCGLIAKKYSPYLNGFHERIKRRRGGGKANVALAKKLLSIVYDALKRRIVFSDFANYKYRELEAV